MEKQPYSLNRNQENKLQDGLQNLKKKPPSEVLKNLNFSLNPHLHKKKKNNYYNESKKTGQQPLYPSPITRNILQLRDRTTKKNISLYEKPRLKQTRSFKNGSLSILQNTSEARNFITNKFSGLVQTGKSSLSEKGKDRLRLQVVRWFIEHKNEVVQQLNEKKAQLVEWITYVSYVNKQEFELIMEHIGIKKDRNLLNRLFWLFDLNGDDQIDHNEIIYSVNLFKEYTLEEKVQNFYEICDDNGNGYLDSEELKKFFIKNLISEEEIKVAKFLAKDFLMELNPFNPNKGVTKEELYQAAITDNNVKLIIEKNTRILKTTKQDDYITPLSYLIPVQETDNRSGIFFPYMDNLMKIMQENQNFKSQHTELMSLSKNNKKTNKLHELNNSNDSIEL